MLIDTIYSINNLLIEKSGKNRKYIVDIFVGGDISPIILDFLQFLQIFLFILISQKKKFISNLDFS